MTSESAFLFSSSTAESSIKILIVEDDPLMQLGLEHYLEEFPQFQIIGCEEDGYQGVEKALQLSPDIVIMDIGLPQLDGIAATCQIKKAMPDLRVVILTSHNTETELAAALASGADAYCIKGTSVASLQIAIAAAMEGAIYLDPQIARHAIQYFSYPSRNSAKYSDNSNAHLSDRELEILNLIVDGKNNSEISEISYLSVSTVKVHIRNIMNKLAVNDRVQAAVVALRSGLV